MDAALPGTPSAIASPRWYALAVRGGREKRVCEEIEKRDIEAYLPLWVETLRWSDREKSVARPLFPGYLFARFDASRELIRVLQTPDVLSALGFTEYTPEPIEDAEISTLRRVVDATPNASPCAYVAGEAVRVETGPLAGTEGVVIRTKGATRLVIRCEVLKRAVSVEIDAADLGKK